MEAANIPAKRGNVQHLLFLDGVRGLAALYVIFHHATMNLPAVRQVSLSQRLLIVIGRNGHYAVDVFIVLSGYCLMLPQLDGRKFDMSMFLKRRAWRIIPPYYIATLLSLVLIRTVLGSPTGTHWDVSLPVTSMDVAYHALLVHDWTQSAAKINHCLWSIGVEWKIYFLFPALLALRSRYGAAKMAAFASLAGYLAWLICVRAQVLNPSPSGSSFYYVGLFAGGMFAAETAEWAAGKSSSNSRKWRIAFVVLSVGTFLIGHKWHGHAVPLQVQSAVVGSWAVSLLVILRLGHVPDWFAGLFRNRASVAVGRIAYSAYLVHAPVLQLVFVYVIRPLEVTWPFRLPLMVSLGTIASLCVALPFYYMAELPFHTMSRRVSSRAFVDRRPAA